MIQFSDAQKAALDASWMPRSEAWALIEQSIAAFRAVTAARKARAAIPGECAESPMTGAE